MCDCGGKLSHCYFWVIVRTVTLRGAGHPTVRTLKQPVERPMWRGAESSHKQPEPTCQPREWPSVEGAPSKCRPSHIFFFFGSLFQPLWPIWGVRGEQATGAHGDRGLIPSVAAAWVCQVGQGKDLGSPWILPVMQSGCCSGRAGFRCPRGLRSGGRPGFWWVSAGGPGRGWTPTPLGCSTLSNRMSISQGGVCENRSTATALTGRKGPPFTRFHGALQRSTPPTSWL